jgi:hypothetical protein
MVFLECGAGAARGEALHGGCVRKYAVAERVTAGRWESRHFRSNARVFRKYGYQLDSGASPASTVDEPIQSPKRIRLARWNLPETPLSVLDEQLFERMAKYIGDELDLLVVYMDRLFDLGPAETNGTRVMGYGGDRSLTTISSNSSNGDRRTGTGRLAPRNTPSGSTEAIVPH